MYIHMHEQSSQKNVTQGGGQMGEDLGLNKQKGIWGF